MTLENASRDAITVHQRESLRRLLGEILPRHRFYAAKLGPDAASLTDPANLAQFPLTTKAELLADQQRNPPYGTLLTYPADQYTRLHQTSGTQGTPLRWLDTSASWNGMLDCWSRLFDIAG